MGAGQMLVGIIALFIAAGVFLGWLGCLIIGVLGFYKKNSFMKGVGIVATLCPLLAIGLFCFFSTPSQVFKSEFGFPPPPGIRNLQVSKSWIDGSVIFMKFETTPEVFSALLDPGYKERQDTYGQGIPPVWWTPTLSKESHIFEKEINTSDEWFDRYLLIREPSGTTFFRGLHFD